MRDLKRDVSLSAIRQMDELLLGRSLLAQARKDTVLACIESCINKLIERFLFMSRWLLAPMYIGLVGVLAFLIYKFAMEFARIAIGIHQANERQIILSVLSLIDITLVANLLLMVILSGYENFVSRLDLTSGQNRPEWMKGLDFSRLKLKLLGAIVAIAAIDLLGAFMNAGEFSTQELAWKTGIQLVFVISGVLFALTDKIAAQAKRIEEDTQALHANASMSRARRVGTDN